MPQPKADRTPTSAPPQGSQDQESSDSNSGRQDQKKAAEQLQKSGQQVADAGQAIPSPETKSSTAGEWDPLIPESDQSSQSESNVFTEETTETTTDNVDGSESIEANESSESSVADSRAASGEPSTAGELSTANEAPAGGLEERIEAAQIAMERAGISIQQAAELLADAQTAEELSKAEVALARARVAVIVAGQDLLDLQTISQGNEENDFLRESQEALSEANVAIVVATDSILSSRIDLPEYEQQRAQGSDIGRESQLEKELKESIIVFENAILEARADVIGSAPPPKSSDNVPGVAILGGGIELDNETFEENDKNPTKTQVLETPVQQGRMPESAELASANDGASPLIPDDIPDPQGDDIVAQQLREAAIAESDLDLRAKLWEEYKRYKEGL